MGESGDKVFLALQRCVHLIHFCFNGGSHRIKTAAQYTNLVIGLHMGAFRILPGCNLLAGRLQHCQRAGDKAAEQYRRAAAHRQKQS